MNVVKFAKTATLALFGAALLAEPALAQQTAGSMADGIVRQYDEFATLITGGAMLLGIAVGVLAGVKLKNHAENPQQEKLTKPIIYFIVAGILIGLPSFLNTGKNTLGLQTGNQLNQGVYDSIGR